MPDMIESPTWDGNFWTTHIPLEWTSERLAVSIDTGGEDREPSQKQLAILNRIPDFLPGMKTSLEDHARNFCDAIAGSINFEAEGIVVDRDRIQDHFKYTRAVIGSVDSCEGEYFFVSCDCDWEEEHGMQFLIDGSEILRCGPHDGTFVFAETDEEYRQPEA